MKKGVGKVFEVGEVVLVPLANVDKAMVDAQNLTGVIVSKLILIECWHGLL
jgi:hypothetical protein